MAAWDVHEPLLLPWDKAAVTEYARGRMPDTVRVFLVGEHGRFQATMVVRRTTTGIDETLVGLAHIPRPGSPMDALAAITERGRGALAAVAERARMPLSGSVSAVSGWPDLMQRRGTMLPPIPTSLLVGPRAAHLLDLDLESVAAGHRVEHVGRSRLRSVLATFEPRPQGSWEELQELVRLVGLDRIAVAAGIAEPRLDDPSRPSAPGGPLR